MIFEIISRVASTEISLSAMPSKIFWNSSFDTPLAAAISQRHNFRLLVTADMQLSVSICVYLWLKFIPPPRQTGRGAVMRDMRIVVFRFITWRNICGGRAQYPRLGSLMLLPCGRDLPAYGNSRVRRAIARRTSTPPCK
ncbi:MAG: hypothetical protein KGL39_41685 [Patescibacteria group bacterium]|nr:hypothetical protein [Patescibacteria group bacterium]